MSATSTPTVSSSQGPRPIRLDLSLPKDAAELTSIGLGGLLFLVTGTAMEWKPAYAIAAALGFALATWLSRSLGRALICMFGSLGLIAGLMVVIASIDGGVTESLSIGWGFMFVSWWLLAALLALAFRAGDVEAEFTLPLALGCAIGIAIAAVVALKLDFQSNLLFYLVGNEDNAAWVGLATQNDAAQSIARQFVASTLGPTMPLVLGVLGGAQRNGIAPTNAVFAGYTLATVTCPLVAASLLRGNGIRSRVAAAGFTLVTFAWLFLVPALLYKDFGHLSTIWATFAFVAFASLVAFDPPRPLLIPVAIGVLMFLGGSWFPIAPLAALLALIYCAYAVRDQSRPLRVAVIIVFVLALIVTILQLRAAGVAIGTDLGALAESIKGLYGSPGGVAQLDTTLKALVIIGVVGLAFLGNRLGMPGRSLLVLLGVSLAYVIAVTAGSAVLNSGDDSYGATKVTFVILFASAVILSAIVAKLPLNRQQTAAAILALTFGAMTFGGGILLLQRAWPGDGTFPSWLPAVEAVVASQRSPRPIVCFAGEKAAMESYQCTRWAGALTPAGDGAFLDYRLMIVNGGTGAEESLRNLEAAGTLPLSDVLFLEAPTKRTWWGPTLLNEGGRVFGPDGKPLTRRSNSAIR